MTRRSTRSRGTADGPPAIAAALRHLLSPGVDLGLADARLRVWMPGCGGGVAVYGLAMQLAELLGHPTDLVERLRIFATDPLEANLVRCRRATYPAAEAAALPAEGRRRYGSEEEQQLVIGDPLRRCVVFARHALAEDPSFPDLDLIVCRHHLDGLADPLRERLLDQFRFSLQRGGVLVLAAGERLGEPPRGFDAVAGSAQTYRVVTHAKGRRPSLTAPAASPAPELAMPSPLGRSSVAPFRGLAALTARPSGSQDASEAAGLQLALLEAVVRLVGPAALVVGQQHELVQVIGDVSPYCRLPEGSATAAADAYLRPDLQPLARSLLLQARARGEGVSGLVGCREECSREALSAEPASPPSPLRLSVQPLPVGERQWLLLSFHPDPGAVPIPVAPPIADGAEVARLEQQLLASQDSLRRSLQQLEQAHEDLQAHAEELQASSEELQTSHEELEAANEQLQAANADLGRLNVHLQGHSGELERLNTDLRGLLHSLNQGMVIVDAELRVVRYSPLAVRLFGLIEADIGRPLLEVPTRLPLPGLREALQAAVAGAERRSLEASGDDVVYLVQVQRHQQGDGRRQGAIVTLSDMSELAALHGAAEASLAEFSGLTDALEAGVWKRDHSLRRLLYASRRLAAITGWAPLELCNHPELLDAAILEADRPRVAAARQVGQGEWSVRYRLRGRDGRQLWVQESARVVGQEGELVVMGTLADVTDLEQLGRSHAELAGRLDALLATPGLAVAFLDQDLQVLAASEGFGALVRRSPRALVGMAYGQLTSAADDQQLRASLAAPSSGAATPPALPAGWSARRPAQLQTHQGPARAVEVQVCPYRRHDGSTGYTLRVEASRQG
ncbi:CheR family methyltransferase [Vulcanococcus limneticus]|uniref:CheR family methyltransferase n=1 Tax=Vulcanococcus limneticus TaxID=2170428 RepID=UPI00398BC360